MQSSVDILVPKAHPLVGEWYDRTPAAADGMPPHITLLWPWVPTLTPDALARLRGATSRISPFTVSLNTIGRFPGVVHVSPSPVEPVLALSRAIWREFPETPPYGGELDHEPVPHLTAAKGDGLDAIEEQLRERLRDPLEVRVDRIFVSQEGAGDGGRWGVVEEVELTL